MTALAEIEARIAERVQAAGTSFFWAMRLLPAERRAGMFAIYAFCREVDDIADGDEPPSRKLALLADWRRELDRLYAGEPVREVAIALLGPLQRYGLLKADFEAVIDGMEMDAREDITAPSLATLDLYCARVASAVGKLSVRVFGADGPVAVAAAESLGRALQLTNILRDLAEDASRGRLYLPMELLQRHGVPPGPASAAIRHPNLPLVGRDLAGIARGHFAAAAGAMARCPRRAMRPAALMGAMYAAILDRLVEADWRQPELRVGLPSWQKIWLVLRHGFT
ncbi:MAG: presqualene diphosphate synthase HpnD [Proteobacteria bacterium]|nr:presqualene diphosphate synthase HpnD [Pseudomonadota bacterium]MBI3499079.1 presqualene diphosphate synthase HpnD [Pseudomonadota bacterium]